MKNKSEVHLERKQPLNCEDQNIKKLLLRILERALMDMAGTNLGLPVHDSTGGDRLYKQALGFIRSEWCLDICETVGIDYYALSNKAQRIAVEHSYKSIVERKRKEKSKKAL